MTTPSNRLAGTPLPTTTYAAAYAQLAAIADKLRSTANTGSVDTLVDDIRQARAAHAICRTRLDAIRHEIDVEIAAVEADASRAAD